MTTNTLLFIASCLIVFPIGIIISWKPLRESFKYDIVNPIAKWWKDTRYGIRCEREWLKTWRDILPDKIDKKKQWLIPEAAGRADTLFRIVAKAMREEKIPSAELLWEEVSYEQAPLKCLIVSHQYLIGLRLYFGSCDYGEYLKSVYFIVSDSPALDIGRELKRREKRSHIIDEEETEKYRYMAYQAKEALRERNQAWGVRSIDYFTEGDLREMDNFFQLAVGVIEKKVEEFEYNVGRETILAGATKGFVDIT